MKFKKIFALGFAASALALASCSNDELEGGDLNPTESGKGYISVSFTTNTNSSRANNGINEGDGHGTADDSGHTNVGTTAENKVNSVLIIGIGGNLANSFSRFYDNLTSTSPEFAVSGTGSNALYSSQAIEVAQDTYSVNVIVNPAPEIVNLAPKLIKEHVFDGSSITMEAALAKVIGASKDNFMMSGKQAAIITVASTNNSEANAATGSPVEVERVVAKIAFRPTTPEGSAVNVYPVTVTYKHGKTNEDGSITTTTETKNWFVKLEKYALVNLSNKNHAVRHTSADFTNIKIGEGSLGASEYLVDPWTVTKNGLGTAIAADNWDGSTYFYNSLKNVTDATVSGTGLDTYFSALPTANDDTQGAVTGNAANEPNYIGYPLTYCFENAVKSDMQKIGLSTGIAFQAKIYENKECTTPLSEELYRYAGNYYATLLALSEAYGNDPVYGITETNGEKKSNLEGKTDTELNALGIEHYKGGVCYYYTAQIKHFDNGQPETMGIMEFAIMRNNIYSLAVESISEIGVSSLEPFKPDTNDEEPKTYIKVQAKILPWIVRFNNIKF